MNTPRNPLGRWLMLSALAFGVPNNPTPSSPRRKATKLPLTKKQTKARAKAKLARKQRKQTRKRK